MGPGHRLNLTPLVLFLFLPETYAASRQSGRPKKSIETNKKNGGWGCKVSPFWFRHEKQDTFFSPEVFVGLNVSTAGYSSPLFPDLDGDGSLEYFYNNHYHLWNFHHGYSNVSYVFGSFEKTAGGAPIVMPVDVHFALTDPVWPQQRYDSHGGFILDLDDDGHPDLYMADGAGAGAGIGPVYASILYWGAANAGGARWTLAGGLGPALDAGLDNQRGDGRGNFAHAVDVDGDGRLDVLLGNHVREDGRVAPGRVLYNNGDRTFSPDPIFREYINVAIYGSNDGDGSGTAAAAADSLIVHRGGCPESRQADFCSTRRSHSWVVYTYDPKKGRMSVVYDSVEMVSSPNAQNIQTEDINGDGIMDFMLAAANIELYYSSPDQRTTISNRGPSETIPNPAGMSLDTAIMRDFDLDGHMDIFAVYSAFIADDPAGKRVYKSAVYRALPGATRPPFFRRFPRLRTLPMSGVGDTPIYDIASVDYNSDGFFDVTLVDKTIGQLHLTNTYPTAVLPGCRTTPRPNYLAVVLVGDPSKQVNRYAIGAALVLTTTERTTGHTRKFLRSVVSYSNGSTKHGGAEDHRTVFGLGSDYVPAALTITWPNGRVMQIEKKALTQTNSMTAPLTVHYSEDPAPPSSVRHSAHPFLGWWRLDGYSTTAGTQFSVPPGASGYVAMQLTKLRAPGRFHLYLYVPPENSIRARISVSTDDGGVITLSRVQAWANEVRVVFKYKKLFQFLRNALVINNLFRRLSVTDDRLIIHTSSKQRKIFFSKYNSPISEAPRRGVQENGAFPPGAEGNVMETSSDILGQAEMW